MCIFTNCNLELFPKKLKVSCVDTRHYHRSNQHYERSDLQIHFVLKWKHTAAMVQTVERSSRMYERVVLKVVT